MVPEESKQIQFEFLPLTLSIETLGGLATPFVKRGTPLPAKRSQVLSTATDNQASVEIKVLFGERPLADRNLTLGSCQLGKIQPAPKGVPQIRVTFQVDKYCNVIVEAVETKSGHKVEATLKEKGVQLTTDLIQQLLSEAAENREVDKARSLIATAELRIRKDQEKNSVSATTKRIETLIADIGLALMKGDKSLIVYKTNELEKLIGQPEVTISPFEFGDIFDSFFQPRTMTKQVKRQPKTAPVQSKQFESEQANSLAHVPTPTTAVIQSFLESIDTELELKREGAWEAVNSNRPDSKAQASHSMREVLRLLLDKLAPIEKVQQAPWYQKPPTGAPVTRAMRIRYAVAGDSDKFSESTLSMIDDLSAAVDSMYAKLSAESHTDKKTTVSATRMYLAACEAIIGLIAVARYS